MKPNILLLLTILGISSLEAQETNSNAIQKSLPLPENPERTATPTPTPYQVTVPENTPEFNKMVVKATTLFPQGGDYSVSSKAIAALRKGTFLNEKDQLEIKPEVVTPSFCSGATYMALLEVLAFLQYTHQIPLSPEELQALAKIGQPDGNGIWGRWNANGPGTAKLVEELNAGINFTDLKSALPGDFLKIWWTEEIGSKEKGHSVIYLGTETKNGKEYLCFWSSNIPEGYSSKCVPIEKCKRLLFTRITKPQNFKNISKIEETNTFLADMLKRPFTWEEVKKECKVVEKP